MDNDVSNKSDTETITDEYVFYFYLIETMLKLFAYG
jgi:hypothetical protein